MENSLVRFCVHCGVRYTAPNDDTVICRQCWEAGVVNPPPLGLGAVIENWITSLNCEVVEEKKEEKEEGYGVFHPCLFFKVARMFLGMP